MSRRSRLVGLPRRGRGRRAAPRLAWRRAVFGGEGGDRRSDAFRQQLSHDQHAVEAGDAYADLVADAHGVRLSPSLRRRWPARHAVVAAERVL
jgi:hypothetical protein